MFKFLKRYPSQIRSAPAGVKPSLAATLAKREMARRASTVRVMGYIIAPIFSVCPIFSISLMKRAQPGVSVPFPIVLITTTISGLIGTFNAILTFGPSVIAGVLWPYWTRKQERRQRQIRSTEHELRHSVPNTTPKPPVFDAIKTGEARTTEDDTGAHAVDTTTDNGMEFLGHLGVREVTGFESSIRSTIGYDPELAEIYRGL
jgi:hypothetical protein